MANPSPPPPALPPAGWREQADVNTRAIWITIGVIVVTIVAILVGLYGLFAVLRHLDLPLHVPQTAVRAEGPSSVPAPQIQGVPPLHPTVPRQDMAAYVAEQRRVLSTYGPTTQPGYARIPIDRAIDLTVSSTGKNQQGGENEGR